MNSASSPWYQSPPDLVAANGATVSMSANEAGGSIPEGDTRIVSVDGQTVGPTDAADATVRIRANLRPGG
jgi:hypothetical protein